MAGVPARPGPRDPLQGVPPPQAENAGLPLAGDTVFLLLTALIRNFYKTIIQRLDLKRFGLKDTSRIKAFIFRFDSVPAK